MNKSSKNYLLNFLLIILLTAFGMWIALKDNYKEVLETIRNIDKSILVIILIWGLLYQILVGGILTSITRRTKKNYRLRKGVVCSFIGAFFSGITPSATGGQFAQAYVFHKQGLKVSDGASILWIDFIIYQSVMTIYAAVMMLLKFNYYYSEQKSFFILVLIGFFISSAVIVALILLLKLPKLYVKLSHWIVKLLHRIHFVKDEEKTLQDWNKQLYAFLDEIKQIKGERKLITKIAILNVIRLTMYNILPFIIMIGIGLKPDFSIIIDVIALSSFVSLANSFFPVPGASGGTEVTFLLIFKTLLKDNSNVSSIMVLWRLSTYHFILIVGGIIFMVSKVYYDHIQNRFTVVKEESECE